MKISIVIPSYNRAHRLKECLDSVINQTYDDKEIILIDNNSTDNTKNFIVNNYPNVKYFFEEKQGVGYARNLGIIKSTGKWIHILDSDNKFSCDTSLDHLVSIIKENQSNSDLILTSNVNQNNHFISHSQVFDSIIDDKLYMKTNGEFSVTASASWYKNNLHPTVKNVIHELGLIIYFNASINKRIYLSSAVIQKYDTAEQNRVSSINKSYGQCYDLYFFYTIFLNKYESKLNLKNYTIFYLKAIIYSRIVNKSIKFNFKNFHFYLIRFAFNIIPSRLLLKILNTK